MNEIFNLTTRPEPDVFSVKPDTNESCLAGFVSINEEDFPSADIVIVGFQDTEKNHDGFNSREIREEFYKLTNFGIDRKIFDLGNFTVRESMENTLANFSQLVEKLLRGNKRLIVIGGNTEISNATCAAMAGVYGKDRWLAINVDSRLDVRNRNGSQDDSVFRRLIEENGIVPGYFYELGFQPYYCSPALFRFMKNTGVKMVSLEQLRSRETADSELRELIRQEFIHHSNSMSILFNFSMNAVRASDAPGVTAAGPFGLRAGEFLTLAEFAAKLVNTKIVQFSEFAPKLDIEHRTAKLIAIAMHRFCSSVSRV